MTVSSPQCWRLAGLAAFVWLGSIPAAGQMMAKAQVANLIVRVENGVDEFRDYLERRGENARSGASPRTATVGGRRFMTCSASSTSNPIPRGA